MNAQQKLLQTVTSTFCVAETILIHSEWSNSSSAPKCQARFHFSALLISIFFPLAGDRLRAATIPHWSFRSHFLLPNTPPLAHTVMITMSGFADSSLTCLSQRKERNEVEIISYATVSGEAFIHGSHETKHASSSRRATVIGYGQQP
jgi:hypothetical protein